MRKGDSNPDGVRRVCVVGGSGKLGRYLIEALSDDSLVRQAPAIVSCGSESALRHTPASAR